MDQFRYDYLLRFRTEYKQGLDRLLTRGAVFSNAYYQHFPTVTAIGHSTFMSGATPSISGIVGNDWFDRETGKLSDSDYQSLKMKYTAAAVEALRAESAVGGMPDDVEAMIAARVRSLRSAVASTPPDSPRCPTCGPRLESDAVFCSSCGLRLQQHPVCTRCGTELPLDSRFCATCGTQVAA